MGLYCSTPAFSQSCSILSCAYLTFPAVLTSAALFTNSNLLHKEMSTVFAIKFPSLSISASTYDPPTSGNTFELLWAHIWSWQSTFILKFPSCAMPDKPDPMMFEDEVSQLFTQPSISNDYCWEDARALIQLKRQRWMFLPNNNGVTRTTEMVSLNAPIIYCWRIAIRVNLFHNWIPKYFMNFSPETKSSFWIIFNLKLRPLLHLA